MYVAYAFAFVFVIALLVFLVPIVLPFVLLRDRKIKENKKAAEELLEKNGYGLHHEYSCISPLADRMLFLDADKSNVVFATIGKSGSYLKRYPLSGISDIGITANGPRFDTMYDLIDHGIKDSREEKMIRLELEMRDSALITLPLFDKNQSDEEFEELAHDAKMFIIGTGLREKYR